MAGSREGSGSPSAMWLVVLVLALFTVGCIGGEGEQLDAATQENQSAPEEDVEQEAETNETDTEQEEEPEVELQEESTAFNGFGTGIGSEATGSNFWIMGDGIYQDFEAPDEFEGGQLTFEWESTQSVSGMWIWLRDADANSVHVFEAGQSPFEVELEPNDERVQGAAEIVVIPDQGMPATAHVQAAWEGEITLLVPTVVGSG